MDRFYGATHYSVTRDGVTPQMFYRQLEVTFEDGTSQIWWHYLSYANLWMGSAATPEMIAKFKPIEELK